MRREIMLKAIKDNPDKVWDMVVIGGGATGLGTAVESVTRGYETLLLEQADFSKGTSSRSTKLVHGGVRYLAQGDISLVLEALHERGLLRQNAPHLVKDLAFVIPIYEWWDGPFYAVGMKVYDMMAGKLGLGPSVRISKEETLKAIPNIKKKGLRGGVIYYDGQFDDSRLAINLAQTISKNNGTIINYIKATGLTKNELGLVDGLVAYDIENEKEYKIKAKVVINATGVFVDDILKMDDPKAKKTTRPSQGVHVVLDKEFLQSKSAIMIPKTDDGRVLFAVPWHNKVVVGTTDTLVDDASLEPRALEKEIEFILKTAGKYLSRAPRRKDVLSIFAGLRPLAAVEENDQSTKEISRNHKILVSLSGLVTITGGKWTTYRKMGEDAVDKALLVAGLEEKPSITKNMPIHGYVKNFDPDDHLHVYGSDRLAILQLIEENPDLGNKIHENLDFTKAEVVWAIKEEMARKVEDILARRVRALFLDARASIELAEKVAIIMAKELGKDKAWIRNEVKEYTALAEGYILKKPKN
ncbi:glycerol-3-phosphate dehydrogenase/oxidase [Flexithrix dorotheae]|uniref:glycerol-3-phosphate dehydrogenase/oxidase n=1 Tax=Flexithrix dorotheae TaxID=70993 RepID=UPI0003757A72|nr:glycerol-3-phosphate dehydrogenase/oxidase [Flexithrix dorotheae]